MSIMQFLVPGLFFVAGLISLVGAFRPFSGCVPLALACLSFGLFLMALGGG